MMIDEEMFGKLIVITTESVADKNLDNFDIWQLMALQQVISKKILQKMAHAIIEKNLQ